MLEFLFSSEGRVSRRQLWLYFVLPWYIVIFAVNYVESSLLGTVVDSLGPFAFATNTLMLWPLSVVLGKRIQDRGIHGKRYVKHARIWFVMLSAAIAGVMLGDNRIFLAMFAIVFIYQFAYMSVLLEILQSFWLSGQDHENEFGPRPAS